jgi:SAM-dependent methyltransferase
VEESAKTWDRIFNRSGKVFTQPHPDLPSLIPLLQERKANRILDLGSGSGRHVVYLSGQGFSVFGIDISPIGMDMARQWLLDEGLTADLRIQDITRELPYEAEFFDALFSIQVIHHATIVTIQKIITEIERVLKRGGFIFITVPKLKNQGKEFEEIEPNTFIPKDGREKGLPHHYFTPEELHAFFANFHITDIHLDRIDHYCLSAFKW